MPKCSICGEKKQVEEMENNICLECATAILHEDDMDVGMNDFS